MDNGEKSITSITLRDAESSQSHENFHKSQIKIISKHTSKKYIKGDLSQELKLPLKEDKTMAKKLPKFMKQIDTAVNRDIKS